MQFSRDSVRIKLLLGGNLQTDLGSQVGLIESSGDYRIVLTLIESAIPRIPCSKFEDGTRQDTKECN